MQNVKIGAAYIRVSSDDQLEYSPDSQLKLIREHAERDGYIIPDEYIYREIDGISGKTADKRPQFRLMIATAKEKPAPFDSIFVWKFSRFARNQEEAIMYKNLLKRNGIIVRSISEPSSDSPFSSLIERIIEWMDEYYLINLGQEVKRGMKEKQMRGEATGRAPFGYSVHNKMYYQNEDAKTVKYIFDLAVSGRSLRDIALDLNNKGIKTTNNADFSIYQIRYILQNPAYVGKIRWDDGKHVSYRANQYSADVDALPDGKHDPIISIDVWNAVQERMNKRDTSVKYVRKNAPVIYPLKGLIRCSDCGSALSRVVKNGKTQALQCHKYAKGQCSVSHYISMKTANEAVIDALEKVVETKQFTLSPKSSKVKIEQKWDDLIASERRRLERAKMAFLDGLFSADDYRSIKESVENNIAKMEEAKNENDLESINEKVVFEQKSVEIIKLLKSPDVTNEAKNIALRSIIDKIVYDKKQNRFDIYFC